MVCSLPMEKELIHNGVVSCYPCNVFFRSAYHGWQSLVPQSAATHATRSLCITPIGGHKIFPHFMSVEVGSCLQTLKALQIPNWHENLNSYAKGMKTKTNS